MKQTVEPLKMSNFWTPPKKWQGQPSFLIGGGPSLKDFDFSLLKGRCVLGCNDAFRLGPEIVSYGVFGDASWCFRTKTEMEQSRMEFITCSPTLVTYKIPGLLKMQRARHGIHPGDTVGWNYSTGAFAINVAISLGSSEIYLLGYDLSNAGQDSHWHEHNKNLINGACFSRFDRGFRNIRASLPENVSVYNVTDGSSKLDVFPKITFQQFYERIKQPAAPDANLPITGVLPGLSPSCPISTTGAAPLT